MDRKSLLLILASCSAAVPVAAPALDMSEPTHSLVEFGVGYVTDDAYRFGRYSGLEDEGAYLLGDITAHRYGEGGGFWQARGTNLGLDSRYLRLDFGYQGRHEYFLEYDELPNNFSDTVSTPYINAGDSTLKLDDGLRLTPFEIETRRERIGLGGRLFTHNHWVFDVAHYHETKEGTGKSGSARAYEPGLVGNTNAALLPEPVDYQTDRVNVSLQYAKEQLQFELAYNMSLFDNDDRSLTWEDYFNPDSTGSLALAPDNEFHQVTATLGYQLPRNTRFTGVLSTGLMTQDQDYQPYSVDPLTAEPLPRSSLDGEVWLTTAQLKLASRPLPKLRLSAGYTYNERDNDSSVESYDNVVIADGASRNNPVENRPLSYERNRLDLTANYRINSGMSLRGGYSYDDMSRDYADAEREDTDENTLFAKWKLRPHDDVNLALYAEASERDGSNYRAPADENPAMRKYYLADRDRTKLGALIDYMATDNLSLSLSADYIEDDYDNSEIGLTEATQPTYTLDVSYQPARDVTTHAYYTREDIESTQYGSETVPDEARDWKAEFDDTIDTFGIGAQIAEIRGKWDVGADLTWSKATGDADLTDLSSAPVMVGQYPDLETELTRLKLWALYRYRHNLSFKLSYWYEDYDADNWAYDGLTATSGVNNNLLLLGEETQDYDTSVIAASVIYHFD